ncbi:hypothetical protein BC941DRAFT_430079 [Chlamydoabsidia padenii]|nr:hypothetical protein BC941DRAFT_430079 [Chlamydoabsidia padenii]
MFGLPQSQQDKEEPNAFDLTWRNYLPSISHLCACLPFFNQHQGILLDNSQTNNLTLASPYYNDFYQAKAVRGYLDDQLDDLLLNAATNDYNQNELCKSTSSTTGQPYSDHKVVGYQQQPTIDGTCWVNEQQLDAGSLMSEQVDKVTYHSGTRTPQSMTYSISSTGSDTHGDLSETASQAVFGGKLEELKEKLVYIRNSIGSSSAINKMDDPNRDYNKDSIDSMDSYRRFKASPDPAIPYRYLRKSSVVSTSSMEHYNRRLSYNMTPDLCMHNNSLDSNNRHSFVFSYFNEQEDDYDDYSDDDDDDDDIYNTDILTSNKITGLQDAVFQFGRKWFG